MEKMVMMMAMVIVGKIINVPAILHCSIQHVSFNNHNGMCRFS
jgi:hypothetical protein